MPKAPITENTLFIPFPASTLSSILPSSFTYPFDYEPHPLSLAAVAALQTHLETQTDWEHNFGLGRGGAGKVIGKMFGVLVVQSPQQELGYLAAFSGKLADTFHLPHFVPPIFDSLQQGGFLNAGMQELSRINSELSILRGACLVENAIRIATLENRRRDNSVALQARLFDQYNFLNRAGETKSLRQLFRESANRNPPAGAGECALPKLLQYAFQHQFKPLAMAEFWWGQSPKSAHWKHKHFYPACQEKCAPLLKHMLAGIDMDSKPMTKPATPHQTVAHGVNL